MTREEIEQEIGFTIQEIREVTADSLKEGEPELLYNAADAIAPKAIVEIGARHGTSSTILALVAKKYDGLLISIEAKPQGSWIPNLTHFGVEKYATLMMFRSPWLPWSAELPIDFLLIDGGHGFMDCLVDYHFFYPFVRPGGRIAFHDVYSFEGVRRAILEILKRDKLKHVGTVITKCGLHVYEKLP